MLYTFSMYMYNIMLKFLLDQSSNFLCYRLCIASVPGLPRTRTHKYGVFNYLCARVQGRHGAKARLCIRCHSVTCIYLYFLSLKKVSVTSPQNWKILITMTNSTYMTCTCRRIDMYLVTTQVPYSTKLQREFVRGGKRG